MCFSDKSTRGKNTAKAAKPKAQASKKACKTTDGKKSKYFGKPLKDEPEDISEDSMKEESLPESTVLKSTDCKMKQEKKENDNGSGESDEDEEWEEVEGMCVCVCAHVMLVYVRVRMCVFLSECD